MIKMFYSKILPLILKTRHLPIVISVRWASSRETNSLRTFYLRKTPDPKPLPLPRCLYWSGTDTCSITTYDVTICKKFYSSRTSIHWLPVGSETAPHVPALGSLCVTGDKRGFYWSVKIEQCLIIFLEKPVWFSKLVWSAPIVIKFPPYVCLIIRRTCLKF